MENPEEKRDAQGKRDAIKARIKKLMLHAKSAKELGSLAEAETFTAKVEELMIEYNIEISQIDLDKDENEFDKWMYGESINYKDNQAGQKWRLDLIAVLCKHNFCNYTWNTTRKTFKVYGRMENVDVVVWMYNFLSVGLVQLAVKAFRIPDIDSKIIYQNNRYYFIRDWLFGAVVGINKKLQRQKDESANRDKINSIMLYNDKALEKYLITVNPNVKLVNTKSKQVFIGPAYEKGLEAGENYVINPPLKSGSSQATTKSEGNKQNPKKIIIL